VQDSLGIDAGEEPSTHPTPPLAPPPAGEKNFSARKWTASGWDSAELRPSSRGCCRMQRGGAREEEARWHDGGGRGGEHGGGNGQELLRQRVLRGPGGQDAEQRMVAAARPTSPKRKKRYLASRVTRITRERERERENARPLPTRGAAEATWWCVNAISRDASPARIRRVRLSVTTTVRRWRSGYRSADGAGYDVFVSSSRQRRCRRSRQGSSTDHNGNEYV
jgi:hypothetical protein